MIVVALLVTAAAGQERAKVPVVRATAEGMASARPDRAVVEIGVTTQASTALAAGAQNAKQLTEVMAELKRTLPAGTQIQTAGYSLSPNYAGGPNRAPQITGYTASNVVRVTIDDMDSVSKAIDAATRTGANNINSLQFTVKDEQAVRAEALKQATLRARANAEAMAAALGARIARVIEVEEGGAHPIQPMMRAMAGQAMASTPIEAGTVDVRATVTLTAELAQ
jgi:uncharacterized protein YggE